MDSAKVHLSIPAGIEPTAITGAGDSLLRAAETATDGQIVVRGDAISISGTPGEVELLARLFTHLIKIASEGETPTVEDVEHAVDAMRAEGVNASGFRDDILLTYRGRAIRPKTPGQKRYIDAIRANTVTFCLGPAGTGKTYLAMAMAVAALKRREVGRIVLTRPVVEAGRTSAFCPARSRRRSIPTCARSTTPCST